MLRKIRRKTFRSLTPAVDEDSSEDERGAAGSSTQEETSLKNGIGPNGSANPELYQEEEEEEKVPCFSGGLHNELMKEVSALEEKISLLRQREERLGNSLANRFFQNDARHLFFTRMR